MRSFFILSALSALAAAQTSTTSTDILDIIPTPDALDLEGIRNAPEPTYTVVDGLMSQDIEYVSATAIATVTADIAETPLSVFPAVTSIAINAAGEDDSSATTTAAVDKRAAATGIERRAACATQATIPNYYSVNVASYSAFKADPVIASVASAAPTPQGYYQNFKNLGGASSACKYTQIANIRTPLLIIVLLVGYLGYTVVKTYDVATCAAKCTAKTGCLAFNIYFERDPTLEPGTNCDNPPAFANIK